MDDYTALLVLYISIVKPTEPSNPPIIPTVVNLDASTNLYQINNFLAEAIKYLPNIGGTLKCNMNNEAGIIDVKGVKTEDSEVKSGYFLFEESLNNGRLLLELDEITNCEILSSRIDVSLYNPSKYENPILLWKGYGTIFKDLNFDYKEKEMACYNPESKLFGFYNVSISNIKQSGSSIYDLKITFISTSKPVVNDICYLLSDKNGNSISIEESELWSLVRKEEDGKYYFGKNKINPDGKSDEVKEEDGSVTISFGVDAIVQKESDADSDLGKMNLFKLNTETPSLGLPPSYIGSETEKMMYPGIIITFSFFDGDKTYPSQSSQVLKIEKEGDNNKERFKLFLSTQIFVPSMKEDNPRLRSLETIVSTDLSLTLKWKSEGSTHIPLECSGQGSCDRTTGLCNCYDGFSGSACQRLDCPNNCNGNGRCVPLSELLNNEDLKNYIGYGNKHESELVTGGDKVSFDNQVFGCLCDKRHRGYDCSLIECPSGADPEGATNTGGEEMRDCSGRGICNYNTGICECFDGFSGEGCQTMSQMM